MLWSVKSSVAIFFMSIPTNVPNDKVKKNKDCKKVRKKHTSNQQAITQLDMLVQMHVYSLMYAWSIV